MDGDDDLDVDGGGGIHDGGRSLLSAKLDAYGESLALERRLKREMVWMRCLRLGLGGPVFKRDVVDGRRGDSPRVRDVKLLGSPLKTSPFWEILAYSLSQRWRYN